MKTILSFCRATAALTTVKSTFSIFASNQICIVQSDKLFGSGLGTLMTPENEDWISFIFLSLLTISPSWPFWTLELSKTILLWLFNHDCPELDPNDLHNWPHDYVFLVIKHSLILGDWELWSNPPTSLADRPEFLSVARMVPLSYWIYKSLGFSNFFRQG